MCWVKCEQCNSEATLHFTWETEDGLQERDLCQKDGEAFFQSIQGCPCASTCHAETIPYAMATS